MRSQPGFNGLRLPTLGHSKRWHVSLDSFTSCVMKANVVFFGPAVAMNDTVDTNTDDNRDCGRVGKQGAMSGSRAASSEYQPGLAGSYP